MTEARPQYTPDFDRADLDDLIAKLNRALVGENELSLRERRLLVAIFAAAGKTVKPGYIEVTEGVRLAEQLDRAFDPAQREFYVDDIRIGGDPDSHRRRSR